MPFWALNFSEFWCWGLIFDGRGGLPPPGSAPDRPDTKAHKHTDKCVL